MQFIAAEIVKNEHRLIENKDHISLREKLIVKDVNLFLSIFAS